MKRRRPFGVTVIAVVFVANMVAAVLQTDLLETSLPRFVDDTGYLDLARLIVSVVGVLLAIGLWRLHPLAWATTMAWAGITMVTSLLAYFRGEPQFISMALSVVAVFYLNSREVQGAFHPDLIAEEEVANG
jgi:hypothetical protein